MKLWLIGCIFVALFCLGLAFGGCAHQCLPPEERAAKFGTVLECKDVHDEKDVRCMVSTPDGDVYHFFKSCE